MTKRPPHIFGLLLTVTLALLVSTRFTKAAEMPALLGLEVPDFMLLEAQGYPGFQKISVSRHNACGINDIDQTITCWGWNWTGQSQPPAQAKFLEVSTGSKFSCGILVDNTLKCWGLDDAGRTSPPKGKFKAVTVGVDHACALNNQGKPRCWGESTFYQLYKVPEETQFKSISAGLKHTCGIRLEDDTVECWQAGLYSGADPPKDVRFRTIRAGTQSTCGTRMDDGVLTCWGRPVRALRKFPNLFDKSPIDVPLQSISDGCGLTSAGTIRCWLPRKHLEASPPLFEKLDGSCGIASGSKELYCYRNYSTSSWKRVSKRKFKEVSGGSARCGIRADDSVICFNLLGRGSLEVADDAYRNIVTARSFACAIRKSDSRVKCWGDTELPETQPPDTAFDSISAGERRVCGIRSSDSQIECWGRSGIQIPTGKYSKVLSSFGVCGIREDKTVGCWGNQRLANVPKGEFKDLSMGLRHACALTLEGEVICWGEVVRNFKPGP